jgi:hypothetical protein
LIETHARGEENSVAIIRVLQDVAALGVDGDHRRIECQRRVVRAIYEIRRIEDRHDGAAGGTEGTGAHRFRGEADIIVDADLFARDFGAGNQRVLNRAGVEFCRDQRLIGENVSDLIAALRIERYRPRD